MGKRNLTKTQRNVKRLKNAFAQLGNTKIWQPQYLEKFPSLPKNENAQIRENWKWVTTIAFEYGAKFIPKQPFVWTHVGTDIVSQESGESIKVAMCSRIHNECIFESSPSPLVTALTVAHEWFHLLTPRKLKVESGFISRGRFGISMHDTSKGTIFFQGLEEAVVSILCSKLYATYLCREKFYLQEYVFFEQFCYEVALLIHNSELRSKERENLKDFFFTLRMLPLEDMKYLLKIFRSKASDGYKFESLWAYMQTKPEIISQMTSERLSERFEFLRVIIEISEICDVPTNQIFAVFARSHFTGNVHPIARLLRTCYGPGSFRQLGLNFAEYE